MFAGLRRETRDLDRVVAWNRVFGMVNGAPSYGRCGGAAAEAVHLDRVRDAADVEGQVGAGR